jgi:hypothetical protein
MNSSVRSTSYFVHRYQYSSTRTRAVLLYEYKDRFVLLLHEDIFVGKSKNCNLKSHQSSKRKKKWIKKHVCFMQQYNIVTWKKWYITPLTDHYRKDTFKQVTLSTKYMSRFIWLTILILIYTLSINRANFYLLDTHA